MSEYPVSDLCPHPDDTLMAGAWMAALSWHLREADARKAFENDTGHAPFRLPRSGIERMIDEATGYDGGKEYVVAFTRWFNANVWGDPDEADVFEPEDDDDDPGLTAMGSVLDHDEEDL